MRHGASGASFRRAHHGSPSRLSSTAPLSPLSTAGLPVRPFCTTPQARLYVHSTSGASSPARYQTCTAFQQAHQVQLPWLSNTAPQACPQKRSTAGASSSAQHLTGVALFRKTLFFSTIRLSGKESTGVHHNTYRLSCHGSTARHRVRGSPPQHATVSQARFLQLSSPAQLSSTVVHHSSPAQISRIALQHSSSEQLFRTHSSTVVPHSSPAQLSCMTAQQRLRRGSTAARRCRHSS